MPEVTQDLIKILLKDSGDPNLQLPDPALEQYYNDFANRTIWLLDEIGEDTLDIVSKIVRWNREDWGVPVEKRKPIKIYVFSPGGSLDVQDAVCTVIKLSKTPVYGIAIGMVASAASLIYLSTHKKFALRNAYMILHKGSCANISGDYDNVQNAMEDYRRQVEKLVSFYIEHTKIPEEVIKEKIKSDWYIRGEKLIEGGLVDQWVDTIEDLL